MVPGGHRQYVPDPKGMSGGPVFRLDHTRRGEHKLVGILTNWPVQKAIIATHIAVVLDALRHLVPAVADQVPASQSIIINSVVSDLPLLA
jgi:hypothetical protein